ncbi:MAG: hypothetical protein IPH69_05395 [Bacteroidales bacterium]|nr:hypothetical protein [Bacteroidales bacterium]
MGIIISEKALHIKESINKIWRVIIQFLMTLLLSIISFAVIFGLLQGGILMTNRLIGQQTDYEIKGIVIDTSKIISRGGYHYYITIDDKILGRPIEFRVKKGYNRGENLTMTVKKGSLGLLYLKD